jgi:hypothetical protein
VYANPPKGQGTPAMAPPNSADPVQINRGKAGAGAAK